MAWTPLRSAALPEVLCIECPTTAIDSESTTMVTSRAVIMAIPCSPLILDDMVLLLSQYGGMSVHTLDGYPYSVFRPVTACWIFTGLPDFGFSWTRTVTITVRPPFDGSGSSWNAGKVAGAGGFGWFTM